MITFKKCLLTRSDKKLSPRRGYSHFKGASVHHSEEAYNLDKTIGNGCSSEVMETVPAQTAAAA